MAGRGITIALPAALLFLSACSEEVAPAGEDDLNIEYIIEGSPVALSDGVSRTPAAMGSASAVETRIVGDGLRKDLDGDGRDDIAHLLTQERGGTGTFYYLVAALSTDAGPAGTQGYFLGDRILIRGLAPGPELSIEVHFADRRPEDPMSAEPTVQRRLRLMLNPGEMRFDSVGEDPQIAPLP